MRWSCGRFTDAATEAAYNDAYWLAQAYFLTHQYERAEQLLTTPLRCGAVAQPTPGTPIPVTGAQGDALHAALAATRAASILPTSLRRSADAGVYTSAGGSATTADQAFSPANTEIPSETDSLADEMRSMIVPADIHAGGPCLVNWSTPCRYLAAQCQVRLGKLHEALELTGEDHTRWSSASAATPALDGGLKLGSSVCLLRGQIYLRLDEVSRAKEAFLLALALDVKNYDAFSSLIDGHLLGADEQWDVVTSLEFAAQAGDDADAQRDFVWVQQLYMARLTKRARAHGERAAAARQALVGKHAAMRTQGTVLLSLAEALYARRRYEDAYAVTSHLLSLDAGDTLALPIHVACMYYLPQLRPALFLLAHHLTDARPESCEAWYAVGVWYASAARWVEARRYFSKASLLDPRFAPAWIAFAHSFALEGESDQAITAYSTAARKFQFSGLPRLCIGMEHLAQGNRSLAQLFLASAAEEMGDDPLCANERGVAAFHAGRLSDAVELFQTAAAAAADTQQPTAAWISVHLNLGLALRREGRDAEARSCFLRVIDYDAACATAYIALGMCAHREGHLADAIGWYHEGLGIDPRDPVGTELLAMALDARVAQGVPRAVLGHVGECLETSDIEQSAAAAEAEAALDSSQASSLPPQAPPPPRGLGVNCMPAHLPEASFSAQLPHTSFSTMGSHDAHASLLDASHVAPVALAEAVPAAAPVPPAPTLPHTSFDGTASMDESLSY